MTNTKTLLPVLSDRETSPVSRVRWLLFLFFCVGVVLGTFFGQFFPFIPMNHLVRPLLWTPRGTADFLWLSWCFSWPCLIAFFLSTSYIGHLFMPVLFVTRGFLLSSCVTVLLQNGLDPLSIWGQLGIPALFSLPALYLIGEQSFDAALSLFHLCVSRPRASYQAVSSERLVFSAVLLLLAALSRQFLIPLLR